MIKRSHSGFTLIEIAIVLLIVSIILGYTVAMVPIQQELKQYRTAEAEMDRIIESLYAFAQVNGYLPCPALSAGLANSNGFECRDGTGPLNCDTPANYNLSAPDWHECFSFFGEVPGKTLGIEGDYDRNGRLVDPWGNPYQYQVTDDDSGGPGGADFVLPGEMKAVTMQNLSPDLYVCNTDPSFGGLPEGDTTCGGAANEIAQLVPAVVVSTGKPGIASSAQAENLDNGSADKIFVKMPFSDSGNAAFNDIVKWIAPNILYSRMIEAGQLP